MLGLSLDLDCHVMVATMGGIHIAADHERVYAAIEDLDRNGREKRHSIALVFVVAKENEPPDAHWRRRFAEQRKTLGSPAVFLSIVSDSPILRGVLTAMRWIVPEPPHMTSETHATFEQCAAWIEGKQGTPRAALRALFAGARSSSRMPVAKVSGA